MSIRSSRRVRDRYTTADQRPCGRRKRNGIRPRSPEQTKNPYEDDEQRLVREFDKKVHGNGAEDEHEALDEVLDEDLDIFHLPMANRDDGSNVCIAVFLVKITRNEILGAQRYDDFCQTILTRQDRHQKPAFFEDDYGILWRQYPTIHDLEQIVFPETLQTRILDLAHYSKFAGHLGQTRMYRHLRPTYYWPQMTADVNKTVRTCNACAKNRFKLRERTHPSRLFPARNPLEALPIDILDPLTKKKKGYRFFPIVTNDSRS